MTEIRFIMRNEESWKALEAFNLRIAKGGMKKLEPEDVREFARLFRLTSHHLAYAKTHYPTSHVLPYLNKVLGVSHNYFYVRKSRSTTDIKKYFLHTFPSIVRSTWRFWVLAMAFFIFGTIFAGAYVINDPYRLHEIMPGNWGDGFVVGETPDLGDGAVPWEYSLMAAVITTNNIQVSFNAIVGGLLAGLGTVAILVYNGLIVGALFGFFYQAGADMLVAYALVLPHGVIELMAIFLAGGCGLMLGKGLLLPGDYTRKESIIIQAKNVAKLLPGIITLLAVAGIIEGYFTPLPISPVIKLVFAALTGALLVLYLRSGKDNA